MAKRKKRKKPHKGHRSARDHVSNYKRTVEVLHQNYNTSGVLAYAETFKKTYDLGSFRITSRLPDWKNRIRKGLGATTSLAAGRRSLHISTTGYARDSLGGSAKACNVRYGPSQLVGSVAIPTAMLSSYNETLVNRARDDARINLVKSYRGLAGKYQSGVFLGELREAIQFLKSPAKRLERESIGAFTKLAKDLKRLGEKLVDNSSSRALRVATDAHLAYTYAVAPMVSDINAADKALTEYFERNPHVMQRIVGNGRAKTVTNQGTKVTSFSQNGHTFGSSGAGYTRSLTEEVTVRLLGGYKSQSGTPTQTALELLSLTPDNWAPTAWELIPWSFVIDYVSNVGGVIDAYSFQSVELAWLQETRRQTNSYVISGLSHSLPFTVPPQGGPNEYSYGARISDKHFLVNRNPTSNDYVPSFRFKLPGLKQDLNIAALINSTMPFRR